MTKTGLVQGLMLGIVMVAGSTAAFGQDVAQVEVTVMPNLNLQVNGSYKAKDDLLAGTEKFAQGASQVTEINLDPTTMGMIGQHYGPDGQLTKKMKLMVVRDYTYDKPGAYRMEDVEAYAKKLQDGSWTCPVVSREKDNLSYICAKTDSDQTSEMVILSAAPQKLSFIHMAGSMSLNELSHMSGDARGIERGVEHNSEMKFRTVQPPATPQNPKPGAMPAPPAPPAQ